MGFPGNPVVTGGISVSAPTDTYATHYDFLGQGGLHTVATLTDMQNISIDRRRFGMFVSVFNDSVPENNKTYRLSNTALGGVTDNINDNDNWIVFAPGGGGGSGTLSKQQTFTSTGQQIFTVTTGTLDQILMVFVNGIEQIKDVNYSVTGQVIDFGAVVPTDYVVTVYYFEALSIVTIDGVYKYVENNGTVLTQRDSINVRNGLTAVDNGGKTEIKLGGSLIENTVINLSSYSFSIQNSSSVDLLSFGSGTSQIFGYYPRIEHSDRTLTINGHYDFLSPYAATVNVYSGTINLVDHAHIAAGWSQIEGNGIVLSSIQNSDIWFKFCVRRDDFTIKLDPINRPNTFFRYADEYMLIDEDRWIPDVGAVKYLIDTNLSNLPMYEPNTAGDPGVAGIVHSMQPLSFGDYTTTKGYFLSAYYDGTGEYGWANPLVQELNESIYLTATDANYSFDYYNSNTISGSFSRIWAYGDPDYENYGVSLQAGSYTTGNATINISQGQLEIRTSLDTDIGYLFLKDGAVEISAVNGIILDTNYLDENNTYNDILVIDSDGKIHTRSASSISGGGGIGGSTGSIDNAILRADGTGGNTLQSSSVRIDDDGIITIPTTGALRFEAASGGGFYGQFTLGNAGANRTYSLPNNSGTVVIGTVVNTCVLFGNSPSNTITTDANFTFASNILNVPSIKLSGSISTGIKTVTTSYTATNIDNTILVDNTINETISLPPVSGNAGLELTIKKISNNSATVTIDGNSSETIDGALTQELSLQWQWFKIKTDGVKWVIIGMG